MALNKPTINIRNSNLQQQSSNKITINRVDPDVWSIECTIDQLQLDLCRNEEEIMSITENDGWGQRKVKTLIVRKYYRQAKELMKWIPLTKPVPEFVINASDLSPEVIVELETRIDYPSILNTILKQAVGRIFENIDFTYYHLSIARNLKVRIEP